MFFEGLFNFFDNLLQQLQRHLSLLFLGYIVDFLIFNH